jgi:hypothetical protein
MWWPSSPPHAALLTISCNGLLVVAVQVSCEGFSLPHNQALAIGIITSELVTNSRTIRGPNPQDCP